MKDLTRTIKFLKDLNIFYTVYNKLEEREFILDRAVKAGAITSICIRGSVDLAFDKDGKFIGSYTDSIDSYVKRK